MKILATGCLLGLHRRAAGDRDGHVLGRSLFVGRGAESSPQKRVSFATGWTDKTLSLDPGLSGRRDNDRYRLHAAPPT